MKETYLSVRVPEYFEKIVLVGILAVVLGSSSGYIYGVHFSQYMEHTSLNHEQKLEKVEYYQGILEENNVEYAEYCSEEFEEGSLIHERTDFPDYWNVCKSVEEVSLIDRVRFNDPLR